MFLVLRKFLCALSYHLIHIKSKSEKFLRLYYNKIRYSIFLLFQNNRMNTTHINILLKIVCNRSLVSEQMKLFVYYELYRLYSQFCIYLDQSYLYYLSCNGPLSFLPPLFAKNASFIIEPKNTA